MSTRPKILIVDDNSINLIVLKKVLEGVGATLIEATNGDAALDATLHNDFALAILDVEMPDMDGYELASLMRGHKKTKSIPIMFVTAAYDDEIHMFRGYEAGAVDYLMKPYQPEVLLAKVRIFLELDHDRRELQKHRNRLEEIVTDRVSDIDHLNKMLKLILELDQLIVREKSAGKLIESACNILAGSEGFNESWIVLKHESSGKIKSAQSGIRIEVFKQMFDCFRRDKTPECGKFTQKLQDVANAGQFCSDCGDCGLLDVCKPDNAMIAHLNHQEQSFGWIFVSLPDDLKASEQEKDLFRQIASDLGFALHGIATQQERDKAARGLLEINKKLMRRNEEIQYFYHSLAHELKTPLTSAREFLSFVTERMVGDLNETQAEYLGFAQESCSNLAIYVNDLLDMTRLDTGKLRLLSEPVALQNLILRVLSMMKTEAAKKNIQLRSELEQDIQEIEIDKSRITQVLLNLLTNAVKFTPENGLILVKLYQDQRDPDWINISVTDTGRGIPETQIDYIFRRYYQVDPSNHEQQEGFGLGLYLSREIIKLHGGEISVKSKPDQGSTFQLSLPVNQRSTKSAEKKKRMACVF